MIHARTIPAESGHDGRSGGYFHQGGVQRSAGDLLYEYLSGLGQGLLVHWLPLIISAVSVL